jgi:hypothetical protein
MYYHPRKGEGEMLTQQQTGVHYCILRIWELSWKGERLPSLLYCLIVFVHFPVDTY